MQDAMTDFYDHIGFANLKNSEVSDAKWNIGNINGTAMIGESNTLDLGIVEIENIGVNGGISIGDKTNPFGLFKYNSGVNRTIENPAKSSLSVSISDIKPKIGDFKTHIVPFAQKISQFTNNLEIPVGVLRKNFMAPVYGSVDDAISWVIDQVPNWVWDIGIKKPARTKYGPEIGNVLGNNAAQIIDNVYKISRTPAINLDSNLKNISTFTETIRNISLGKGSGEPGEADKEGTKFPKFKKPLLSFKLNSNNPGKAEDTTEDQPSGDFSWMPDIPSFSIDAQNKVNFPSISSVSGISSLLKNIFLTPDVDGAINLMQVDFSKSIVGQQARMDPPVIGLTGGIKAKMDMKVETKAGIKLSGKELLAIFKNPIDDSLKNIITNYSYWDLANTAAKFTPSVSPNLGIQLLGKDFVAPIQSAYDAVQSLIGGPEWKEPYRLAADMEFPLTGSMILTPSTKKEVSLNDMLSDDFDFGLDWSGENVVLTPTFNFEYLVGKKPYQIIGPQTIWDLNSNRLSSNGNSLADEVISGGLTDLTSEIDYSNILTFLDLMGVINFSDLNSGLIEQINIDNMDKIETLTPSEFAKDGDSIDITDVSPIPWWQILD
jgi:hypothetical protein